MPLIKGGPNLAFACPRFLTQWPWGQNEKPAVQMFN
jgi:hypothetical protein